MYLVSNVQITNRNLELDLPSWSFSESSIGWMSVIVNVWLRGAALSGVGEIARSSSDSSWSKLPDREDQGKKSQGKLPFNYDFKSAPGFITTSKNSFSTPIGPHRNIIQTLHLTSSQQPPNVPRLQGHPNPNLPRHHRHRRLRALGPAIGESGHARRRGPRHGEPAG